MFQVEFYVKPNGECPAQDFLDGLSSANELPIVIRTIGLLEKYGNELRRPHTDLLRDHIWELRIRTRRQIRLLYFFFSGDRIVITHGFIKKDNKVRVVEIERASHYRGNYYQKHTGRLK